MTTSAPMLLFGGPAQGKVAAADAIASSCLGWPAARARAASPR